MLEVRELDARVVGASTEWFESQLADRRIQLHPASSLARGLGDLRQLRESYRARASIRMAAGDFQKLWLSAVGTDFLTKSLHRGSVAGLQGFDRHWKRLKSGNPILTGPSEAAANYDRSLTWELVAASGAAACMKQVSHGEPDILFRWEGMQVGLAAKVLFEPSQRAFLRHVEEGLEQVGRSEADVGCVLMNLADLFPHRATFEWAHRYRFKEPSTFRNMMNCWVADFVEEKLGIEQRHWDNAFRGRHKTMAVAAFVPTVCTLWRGGPLPLPLYSLHLWTAIPREDEAMAMFTQLQRAFDSTLAFMDPNTEETGLMA